MLAWDTETAPIKAAQLAPPLACITFSDGDRSDIVHWKDPGAEGCARWLLEQETTTANGPGFDLAVLWAAFPNLRDLVWEALVEGRVHDVQTRQKLMDIGAGKFRRAFKKLPGAEKVSLLGYSLSDLHARHFGTFMEKDEWRLQYGRLREYPLEQWPDGALKYATFDAVATSRVHVAQDTAAASFDKHNLWDEPNQVRAHFALHLMSCWGFAADPIQVKRVIDAIDAEMPDLVRRLRVAGLVRYEGWGKYVRSEKLAKRMMYEAVGDAGELTETGYKKVKKKEMNKDEALRAGYIKIDEEWCEISKNPALIDYYHFRQNQLLRAKLEHIHTAAQRRLPIQTGFEPIMETGRTSSRENKIIENSMALQNPPRKPLLEKDGKTPLKDEHGKPVGGLRECLVSREGCTLIAADYGQAELVSLAQITYAAFGHSKMRDLLNADRDIHVDFGSQVMATQMGVPVTYEKAWALHLAKDKQMKEMRQMAKCFHGDTEVLTKTGWTKISELPMLTEVAAARFHDGGKTTIHWEVPRRLTTRTADELVHIENENIDLWITPDHRMAAWKNKISEPSDLRDPETGRMLPNGGRQWKKRRLVHEVCLPEELGKKRAWPSAGLCEDTFATAGELCLRLAVAVQADGNYSSGNTIRLGFTKKRKIERMRSLLRAGDIPHEEKSVGSAKVTTFYVRGEASDQIRRLLDLDKTLPWWWLELGVNLREAVLDEARHWDAHIPPRGKNNWNYSSTIKKNVDVVHALASITNHKATLKLDGSCWKLSVKDRANTRGGNLNATRVPWGGDVHCLTVPSDAILVRYNGKTTVTHQCADFGFPGGLGWSSFQSYARKAWAVELTGEQAKQLKRYWLAHFPEMVDYFRWMSDLMEAGDGQAAVQQFMSKRWRGKCFYTQGCNTLFQGLTADAAKAALFEVSRRCYTVPSSALYGCRPVLFVHDEIITEAPREQAAEAALEKEKVMVEIYQRYTPDVRITADAHLMDRWSKDAEATYDERGKLVPWQPPEDKDEQAEWDLLVAT